MYYNKYRIDSLDGVLQERYHTSLNYIKDAKRIVVKFGTDAVGSIFNGYGVNFVDELVYEKNLGKEFVIISSGAIGLAMQNLQIEESNSTIRKAVYASIGQPLLMNKWSSLFSRYNITVSQLLYENENLTGDSDHRDYIKKGLESVLHNDIIPIINENDAVTSEEITTSRKTKTFGDNDKLARLVCELIDSDLMIFYTGSTGVYHDYTNPNSLYKAVFEIDDDFLNRFDGQISNVGRGGIKSKLECSKELVSAGIPVVISSPENENPLSSVLHGLKPNTIIVPKN